MPDEMNFKVTFHGDTDSEKLRNVRVEVKKHGQVVAHGSVTKTGVVWVGDYSGLLPDECSRASQSCVEALQIQAKKFATDRGEEMGRAAAYRGDYDAAWALEMRPENRQRWAHILHVLSAQEARAAWEVGCRNAETGR